MANLDSAFWHDDFGFLFDRTHLPVASTTEMQEFEDSSVAEKLEANGLLPNLNGAPVASWVLPRLVEITRDGINLDDGERLRNDGGCVFLKWVAFTRSLTPRAFFSLLCYSNRITAFGHRMANTQASDLMSAFIAALIEEPYAIRKWRVSVIDMDPPKTPGKRGRTYVFG